MPERSTLPPKSLQSLLAELPGARLLDGDPATPIAGLALDSRLVEPRTLFVAIPGLKQDGRSFIPQAVARGAVAIVGEPPLTAPPGVARVAVASARQALADLAAAFYDHPSRALTLIGVTGTDGKTSTAQLIAAVLETAGRSTGWLTTVDLKVGPNRRPTEFQHTTPEALGVQRLLREMVDGGVEIGVLEVSSHALALERVRGTLFDLAVFTNLSAEHLNFHGTMEAYFETKARLFEMLAGPRKGDRPRNGVVNVDDAYGRRLAERCPVPVVSYALDRPADVTARAVELHSGGARFRLQTPAGQAEVSSRLLGRFNVQNWLAAAAAAHALGVGPEVVARAAAELPPVPGRMEPVERGQPFAVLVDFAHTPQALANALRTLRQHVAGRLLLVFGNAGERDPASRPAMGRIAAELTDFFIISTDDPLYEDPARIAAEVAAGARSAGARPGRDFEIVLDRRCAIERLISAARTGDGVLLAGKGHEPRMLVRDRRLPWSDRQTAEEVLETLERA
jgi:UDP-N-acetylmuramoyl-L-alanyl-D-glutamate--2,6-diaminopimelate ligase